MKKTIILSITFLLLLAPAMAINITGGTETTDGDWTVHTFTSTDTFTVTDPGDIELLLVGGGGGGGDSGPTGAGGGAGGVLLGNYTISEGVYAVSIGSGGSGGSSDAPGLNGGNTTINTSTELIAWGGGGGAGSGASGKNGSSGGGSTFWGFGFSIHQNYSTLIAHGYHGGAYTGYTDGKAGAGGGGGSGQEGQDARQIGSSGAAGDGGNGTQVGFSGSLEWYAGGGGGASWLGTEGFGGLGGGGDGCNSLGCNGVDGTANTGGGGGGATDGTGGSGGSGIVILRYMEDVVPPSNETLATETLEQTSQLNQIGSYELNSAIFETIFTGEIVFNETFNGFAVASIGIDDSTKDNELSCQITLNGTDINDSLGSRTIAQDSSGNMIISSHDSTIQNGTYNMALECRRSAGVGKITLSNSNIIFHQLRTVGGQDINSLFISLDDNVISGVREYTITTTENATETDEERFLMLDWNADYIYTTNENMSLTVELAGTNCTTFTRFGVADSKGSVGASCAMNSLVNSTVYDVKIYGEGSGNLSNAHFHVREEIVHTGEFNMTSLSEIIVNNTVLSPIANVSLSINAGHTDPNIYVSAGISSLSLSNETSASYLLVVEGDNSTLLTRTLNTHQPGVVYLQNIINNVSGVVDVMLYASCANSNCSLNGVDLVALLTDDEPITPSIFTIDLTEYYSNSTVSEFNIGLSGGSILSTSNGTITVSTSDEFINISFPGDNSTTIKYFENNTINHDTNNNLSIFSRRWTALTSLTPDLANVLNFSVNMSNGITTYTTETTTGIAYLPIFNDTYNITIFDAVGEDQTNYAIQTNEFNTSEYINNITFNMKISNSVNVQFFDELTGNQIDDVTLEYFSDSTSGNDTTNNSLMFLNLVFPDAYTFIYDSTGYLQRFYQFTLFNNTFNSLNLTLLNNSLGSTVTVTVKDTLNNNVEGAQVKLLKFNSVTNEYDLLEVRTSNFEGQTVLGVVLNDPLYKIQVEVDGTIVLTTQESQIYGTSLTLIVDLIQTSGFEELFTSYKLSGTVTHNNGTFIFNYNDETNTASQACITIYRIDDNKQEYNRSCSTSPAGMISVYAPPLNGRYYLAEGDIYDSGNTKYLIDSIMANNGDIIPENGSGLLMMILMILMFVAALAINIEVAVIVSSAVPLIFTMMELTKIGYTPSISILAAGLVVAFVIGVVRK